MDLNVSYRTCFLSFPVDYGGDVLNIHDNEDIFYSDRKTGGRVEILAFFSSVSITVSR